MSAFATYGKITAQPGKRDELAAILLEASRGMEDVDGCRLYIVNIPEDDPNTIWVTELWRDAEAHDASLRDERAIALIRKARPLIAGAESIRLKPVGGKGL
jgi:quinol monooxygenase YgiN